jgi:hypothetical protein
VKTRHDYRKKEEGVFEHHQVVIPTDRTIESRFATCSETDWTRRKRASPIDMHLLHNFLISMHLTNHLKPINT